jgi:hypothetical protein
MTHYGWLFAIFLNEEGTENGGLIFDGEKDKDGKVSGMASELRRLGARPDFFHRRRAGRWQAEFGCDHG